MASRPVFVSAGKPEHLVDEIDIEFEWHPGFAPVQKKKNIIALHESAKARGLCPLLEVSTKSSELIGQRLSSFNLKIDTEIGAIPLECAFQGSKVFENGGPYSDLYTKDSRTAKKDIRIKTSGKLTHFSFFGQDWGLTPKTAFYDWLYLTALKLHTEYLKRLFNYKGFTDIEFNPEKSINCQARTCALLVSLLRLELFEKALSSQSSFVNLVAQDSLRKNHSSEFRQKNLF